MWKRCAEGQSWTGSTCAGEGTGITWHEAMPNAQQKTWDAFAGHSDWQVPTRKNLLTLVYCSTGKPKTWNDTSRRQCEGKYQRPTIDTTAFPNVDGWWFWSASTVASVSTHAWVLYFGYGDDGWGQRSHASRVRLVRVGQ